MPSFCTLILAWLMTLTFALAGGSPAHLTLINATPYKWIRTHYSSYQLEYWDERVPSEIAPGISYQLNYELSKNQDDAGNVTYALEINGQTSKKGFQIHVQGKGNLLSSQGFTVSVRYDGGLDVAGHRSGPDDIQFGDHGTTQGDVGGSDSFVLSGDEVIGYTSEEPPIAWMDYLGDPLKALSLSQIVVPASHDSGMWTLTPFSHLATADNTITQAVGIYQQLLRGIRWMDWRPYMDASRNDIYLGHFADKFALGGYGQSLAEAISDVNNFNRDYPGELIVIDMYDGFDVVTALTQHTFNGAAYQLLVNQLTDKDTGLHGINTVYELTNSDGPAKVGGEPLSTFYALNRSPVIVRIGSNHIPEGTPPITVRGNQITGLMSSDQLPDGGDYADTDKYQVMQQDQQKKLSARTTDVIFKTTFTLTQTIPETVGGPSINYFAHTAMSVLNDNLYRWSIPGVYPNLIEYDFVDDHQVAALAMALNVNLAYLNLPVCS